MLAFSFLASFLLASVALAAPAKRQEEVSSPPFALIIQSTNASINGRVLFAAHSGAAIENLNPGGTNTTLVSSNTFVFNTTDDGYTDPVLGPAGTIAWTLRGGNFEISEPLSFEYSPTSDLAVPRLSPSEYGTQFYFVNDTLVIAQFNNVGGVIPLDRFYLCELSPQENNGYAYTSLAWKLGQGRPDNESCQKVTVKRVFP
jgi:hypothetical protein